MRVLVLLSLAVLLIGVHGHEYERTSQALQRLNRDLLEVEIYLKELDVEHTKSLAYGWKEDVGHKLSEWRDRLKAVFEKLRATVRSFVSQLTTREGSALPEWVYTGFSGALEDVLRYIEKRMHLEDNGFRSALLEVLKNVVRIYRNRIIDASAKLEHGSPSGQTPSGIPEPTTTTTAGGEPAPASFRDFWEL